MNATQLRYARERAKQIYEAKVLVIRKKHITEAIELSPQDKELALRKGEFKVIKTKHRWDGGYLSDYISFNAERPQTIDKEATDREIAALTKKYTQLTDKLVLGDATEALEMLERFAKE